LIISYRNQLLVLSIGGLPWRKK